MNHKTAARARESLISSAISSLYYARVTRCDEPRRYAIILPLISYSPHFMAEGNATDREIDKGCAYLLARHWKNAKPPMQTRECPDHQAYDSVH